MIKFKLISNNYFYPSTFHTKKQLYTRTKYDEILRVYIVVASYQNPGIGTTIPNSCFDKIG